jgi:hypothetical protein
MVSKAIWDDGKYGFSYLHLGPFTVVIGWDSTRPKDSKEPSGYKVSFGDATLKARFSTQGEARKAGEMLARRILTKALEEVPDEETI